MPALRKALSRITGSRTGPALPSNQPPLTSLNQTRGLFNQAAQIARSQGQPLAKIGLPPMITQPGLQAPAFVPAPQPDLTQQLLATRTPPSVVAPITPAPVDAQLLAQQYAPVLNPDVTPATQPPVLDQTTIVPNLGGGQAGVGQRGYLDQRLSAKATGLPVPTLQQYQNSTGPSAQDITAMGRGQTV